MALFNFLLNIIIILTIQILFYYVFIFSFNLIKKKIIFINLILI